MLDRFAPYLTLIKVAVVVALVVAGIVAWNAHNAAQQQAGYDLAMSEVAAAQAAAAEARRSTEIKLQQQADQEAKHVQAQIVDLERQRDAARVDADRVRALYRQAAERGRIASAGATGAGPGEPGPDALGVFADLLVRADRRAEEVAGYADRLRIAGAACERQYDAIAGAE